MVTLSVSPPTLNYQKSECCYILGQFPSVRRESWEARGKTESLFRVLSSRPHIHLANDYNTLKCVSVTWPLREYDHL